MLQYLIPFLYTHRWNRVRLDGLAYALEYYGVLFVLVCLFADDVASVMAFLVALTSFMSIYEIGYIENNVKAIDLDRLPTMRHSEDELFYIRKHIDFIFSIRYAFSFVSVAVLSLWYDVGVFIIFLIITRTLFYLYNMKYRTGILNRAIFVALRFLRYAAPVWFLYPASFLLAALVSFVNLINNFAWYKRSDMWLPRFFGTKLFDGLAYLVLTLVFVWSGDVRMAYLFIFMAGIKMMMFIMVLATRKGLRNV